MRLPHLSGNTDGSCWQRAGSWEGASQSLCCSCEKNEDRHWSFATKAILLLGGSTCTCIFCTLSGERRYSHDLHVPQGWPQSSCILLFKHKAKEVQEIVIKSKLQFNIAATSHIYHISVKVTDIEQKNVHYVHYKMQDKYMCAYSAIFRLYYPFRYTWWWFWTIFFC